jgi:ParB/RepB/Spo0J family partition protein
MSLNRTLPIRAEAERQWKEHIAWLREGYKGDKRLADLLAECRKGNRCHLEECPKCERRKEIARLRIPADAVKYLGSRHPISNIRVSKIVVDGKRRPLDKDKVRAIAASMEMVGLQTPITVRECNGKVFLVTGGYRLAAAKQLGWKTIPSIALASDRIETRIWQIVENLYRAELTALERAEFTEELRQLVRQRVGQVAPRGGHQPQDKGINKAAKALGLTKEQIRRSKKIASISPKVKEKVRKLGLDDNQRALLEIADRPTPKAQLRAITEIVERKRGARDRNALAAAADNKTTAEINALDADIDQRESTLKRLKGDLAASRKRRQELDDNLVIQGKVVDRGASSQAASSSTPTRGEDRRPEVVDDDVAVEAMVPAAEADRLNDELAAATERVRSLEQELENARALASRAPGVDTSAKAPTCDEIPPFLDRRLLSAEEQLASDAIMAEWTKCTALQSALIGASRVIQERFITFLRADITSRNSAGE